VIGFDLDGTLVDSRASISNALGMAYKITTGEELDVASVAPGAPLQEILSDVGLDFDQQQLVTAEFKALYDGGICFEAIAYDGIADALDYLAAQTRLYVVTNKRKSIAEKVLEHLSLGRYFDVIDGQAEDQFVLKQEILQRVMSQLGSSDGAYIGDTKGDVDAAIAVGLTPVFCSWGYSDAAYAPPCQIITQPADLFRILPE
jgi:phosphoglycolate phosphatase